MSKKTIVFYLGYAIQAMMKGGYGCYGSELAFTYLYKELSSYYNVFLLSDFAIPGFQILSSAEYQQGHYDFLIISRYINFFLYHEVRASKVLLWLHDVCAHSAFQGLQLPQQGRYLLNNSPVDTIVAQTEWHKQIFTHYYDCAEKIEIIGNGFVPTAFSEKLVEKEPMTFIYTSSPKRGLRWLIPFFPKIQAKYPNATLHIYRGDDELTLEEKKEFPTLKEKGIFYHGSKPNLELAKEFERCQFWLYPTDFPETFCISALEAMAGGCLCICSNLAALTEIVGDRGILLSQKIYSPEYENEILSAIEKALVHKDTLPSKAKTWAMQQTWSDRSRKWDQLLGKVIPSLEKKEDWVSEPIRTLALSSNFSSSLSKDWRKMIPDGYPYTIVDSSEPTDQSVCVVINGNNREPRNTDFLITMESSVNKGHLPPQWRKEQSCLTYNGIEWHLSLNLQELAAQRIEKKDLFCAILSKENRLIGHQYRLKLLDEICAAFSPIKFHLYGKDHFVYPHYWHPIPNKDVLLKYKYTFTAENTSEAGYFTEKIVDAILAETLCFYWGCPDLERYLDSRAFIRLPDNIEQALQIIKNGIDTQQWEERIPYIRNEKRRILLGWNLMMSVGRVIGNFEPVDGYSTLLINLDHRFDRWQEMTVKWLGFKYERFPAVNGKKLILSEMSTRDQEILKKKKYQQKNPYESHNYRGGVLGCIFSHLRIWERVAEEKQFCLVLEDDADHNVEHFIPQWNRTATYLRQNLDKWDFCFLGFHDDVEGLDTPFQKFTGNFPSFSLAKCSGEKRLHGGGTFAYCVSPGGAKKMLALAEEMGIPQPIDWFMIEMFPYLNVWKTIPALVTSPFQQADTDIQRDYSAIQ